MRRETFFSSQCGWLIVLTSLVALLVAVPTWAADIYVAQSQAGGDTGADCADAIAVSALTAGNWSAGNTIHLCGAITSGFTVNGSGTAGNVITVKWESGARISVPDGKIINLNGEAYLLFDGGTACGPGTACDTVEAANQSGYASGQTGILEATANGSALANQSATTQAFYNSSGSHDIEIRNLIIRNLYVHSLSSDNTANIHTGDSVFQCSGGDSGCASGIISLHDSTVHDVGMVISYEKTSGTTLNLYNTDIYHFNWGLEVSGNGTRTLNIYNNWFHDTTNWDSSQDSYHHVGIHNYMNVSSDSQGYYFYNNKAYGDWGSCCTQDLLMYTETEIPASLYFFNNVAIQSCNNNVAPALGYLNLTAASQGGYYYNNTFLGCATTASNGAAVRFDGSIGGTGVYFENNVIQGFGQYLVVTPSNMTFGALNHNVYGPIGESGNGPWSWHGTDENSFSSWQSVSGEGANSSQVSNMGVNSSGFPQAGSALIGAGANLTSVGITTLDSDITGAVRPSTGAWTAGAYGLADPLAPPTNLRLSGTN
jgi:hypothetical protein